MSESVTERFLIKVDRWGMPTWYCEAYPEAKFRADPWASKDICFSLSPFDSRCHFEEDEASRVNKHLRLYGFESVVCSWSEALEEHERYMDSQREQAFREAEEEAARGEGFTEEEWESLPDEYVGNCHKECYGWRVMRKGGVVEFGVRGVYVCTGCGYAYPPLFMPDPRSGRLSGKMGRICEKVSKRSELWQDREKK